MQSDHGSKAALRVGDRIEIAFGEPGTVTAIQGGDVQIRLDSGPTITKSVLQAEIIGISHDFFLHALEEEKP